MARSDFDASGPHAVTECDFEYARPDGEPLLARVYRPRDGSGPWPLLIDVHGGAWSYFDRTVDVVYDRALAACGLVVVALDFRQAPQHRWPTAASDVVAGIRWAKANAATLAATAERTGMIGGSSGGHVAMVAALRPGAPELGGTVALRIGDARPIDVGSIDVSVDYVLPLWPILDPLARYRYLRERVAGAASPPRDRFFQPERLIAAHEAFFGDEATMWRASAQRIVEEREFQALPAIWMAHPELDENVTLAMSERFASAYREAGGDAELEVFPGVGHGFANFAGAASNRCIERMREFIGRRLAA